MTSIVGAILIALSIYTMFLVSVELIKERRIFLFILFLFPALLLLFMYYGILCDMLYLAGFFPDFFYNISSWRTGSLFIGHSSWRNPSWLFFCSSGLILSFVILLLSTALSRYKEARKQK